MIKANPRLMTLQSMFKIVTFFLSWWFAFATYKLKRTRVKAAQGNEALLDDVDIHAGRKTKA